MAPAESIDWISPYAEPSRFFGTDSATITSRGAARKPLDSRSLKRISKICGHAVTTASNGLTAFAIKYPATTTGLRRSMWSARYPEKSCENDATLSAMPSINPNCAGPAPSVARKAGNTQYAISVAVSLKKDVVPNA